MTRGEKLRCFAAVALPRETARELALWRADTAESLPGVRWVKEKALHLTLKFFGDISAESISPLTKEISARVAGCKPFNMELRGLGHFPPRGSARVIWAGVDAGRRDLIKLARHIEAASEEVLPDRREHGSRRPRQFHPHVTLGRIRRPGPGSTDEAVKSLVKEGARHFWGRWEVSSFSLIHSRLTPEGPFYTVLETFPLL